MRILWLSHLVPYPPKGGVLQRAYHLLREVARYHELDLIAFTQSELIKPLFPSLDQGLAEARKELLTFCKNTEFVPVPTDGRRFEKHVVALKSLFTRNPYNINWLKSPLYKNVLTEFLRSGQYDLIHFDTISLMPYFAYVRDIPTVLDHHNIESHMLLRRASNETNIFKKWYFRQEGERLEKVERAVCPKFSLNITCSDIDRERLIRIAPGSWVEEVPNGVDIEYFKPDRYTHQDRNIIFVGTLSWYPNIEAVRFIAHKLWPILKSSIPGLSVDIIGANPPRDIKLLSENEPDFRVHGFVDDIRPYLNRAAVYVCPITDGGGTKLKILDALSMEKPVVAHPIACEGIRVDNERNVLFSQTVDEYVHSIKRLIDDENLRGTLGREARYLIEHEYAYGKIGKKLSDLYEESVRLYRTNSKT